MSKRIPSLDGIRAVALGLVIILHIAERYEWPYNGTLAHRLLVGRDGTPWTGDPLSIFFVLSGYLITLLLLKEFAETKTIAIRHFFERRAFRILPALLVYLALAYVFCLVEKIPHNAQNFTSAILFYRDYYFGPDLWITQHTWSLSIEEQFYLLWPFLLLWHLRAKGRSSAAKWAFALILLTPVLRVAGKALNIAQFDYLEMHIFHCRIDALMSGCLVALLAGVESFEHLYRKYQKFWWALAVEYWIVSLALGDIFGSYYSKSIGSTIDALCMALLILWCSRNENHVVGRVLNTRFLSNIGIASYSAYLYQTFFTHAANPTLWKNPWFGIPGLAVVAWLSYRFIEQPCLRLRDLRKRKKLSRPILDPAESQRHAQRAFCRTSQLGLPRLRK